MRPEESDLTAPPQMLIFGDLFQKSGKRQIRNRHMIKATTAFFVFDPDCDCRDELNVLCRTYTLRILEI